MHRPSRWRAILGIGVAAAVTVWLVWFLSLWAYAGGLPFLNAVESTSMMHVDPDQYRNNEGTARAEGVGWGRVGTLDPGDRFIVKRVDDRSDIHTWAEGGKQRYGAPGDVIVFYRGPPEAVRDTQSEIVHRAITYVEATTGDDGTRYEVQWTNTWKEPAGSACTRTPSYVCTFGSAGVTIDEESLRGRRFTMSGFLTRGDNAVGNRAVDQAIGVFSEPVPFGWIVGVARGELPGAALWMLAFTGDPKNLDVSDHPGFWTIGTMVAPSDVWLLGMLLMPVYWAPVTLGVLTDVVLAISWRRPAKHTRTGPTRDQAGVRFEVAPGPPSTTATRRPTSPPPREGER